MRLRGTDVWWGGWRPCQHKERPEVKEACWGQVEQPPEGSVLVQEGDECICRALTRGIWEEKFRWKGLAGLEEGGQDGVVLAESCLPTAHW